MVGQDGVQWSGIDATPAQFSLLGGKYMLMGALSGTSVEVQPVVGGDAISLTTPFILTTSPAAPSAVADLPPGTYQLTCTSVTSFTGSVARIPQG